MRLRWIVGALSCLAAVSVADATVITACYNSVNGQLRVVTSASACRGAETFVSWNTDGPQGPPGPAGGASTVYVTHAPILADAPLDLTEFAHLDVASGNYIIDAVVEAQATAGHYVHCLVVAAGSPGNFQEKYLSAPTFGGTELNGNIVFQFAAEGLTSVSLSCNSPVEGGGSLAVADLRAVSVGDVHVQP